MSLQTPMKIFQFPYKRISKCTNIQKLKKYGNNILSAILLKANDVVHCNIMQLGLLARSIRQEAAAEGRIDSRACAVNMRVLGKKSCFGKIHHFIQSIFQYFIHSRFDF